MKVIAGNDQLVFDIAIQEYGSIEASFDIAGDNGLMLCDELIAGTHVTVFDEKQLSRPMVDYFKINDLNPATALNANQQIAQDGIGYWYIETDFVVS